MTRNISKKLSAIISNLELEGAVYVTMEMLGKLAKENDIATEVPLVAMRLREAGWLLPTTQKGVWEFAPAAVAGPYSNNDPLGALKAFRVKNPNKECYLCLQCAAWALGLANRLPTSIEIAMPELVPKQQAKELSLYKYSTTLESITIKGVESLAPEAIIVHIASNPKIIRSWDSAMEWIPDVVYETDSDRILEELSTKTNSVKARTGYLLEGMYPNAADAIYESFTPVSKIRFGQREVSIRNNEKWKIADTVLPFNPKNLEVVK